MSVKLDENHFSLTSCQEVKEICKPLFESFGFTHFHFRRTFNDRSRAVLCTNPDWVKYFYDTKKYDLYGIYEELKPNGDVTICEPLFNHFTYNPVQSNASLTTNSVFNTVNDHKPSYVLWMSLFELPVFNLVFEEARHFKIDHGITITEKDENSCTFYQIGTTPEKSHLINFYLNNYETLKIFINYFKEKGAHLIKLAEKNRIMASDSIIQPYCLENNTIPLIGNEQFVDFFKQIEYKSHQLQGLSPREIQSIHYLLKGYSAKQIASALQLSHRTIEFYIASIKTKLQCFTKAQLIHKLHELMSRSSW